MEYSLEKQLDLVADLFRETRNVSVDYTKLELAQLKASVSTAKSDIDKKVLDAEQRKEQALAGLKALFDAARQSSSALHRGNMQKFVEKDDAFFELLKGHPEILNVYKTFIYRAIDRTTGRSIEILQIGNTAVIRTHTQEISVEKVIAESDRMLSAVITATSKKMAEARAPFDAEIALLGEQYAQANQVYANGKKFVLTEITNELRRDLDTLCNEVHGVKKLDDDMKVYVAVKKYLQGEGLEEDIFLMDSDVVGESLDALVKENYLGGSESIKFVVEYRQRLQELGFVDDVESECVVTEVVDTKKGKGFVYEPIADVGSVPVVNGATNGLQSINQGLINAGYNPLTVHPYIRAFKGKFIGGNIIPEWAVRKNLLNAEGSEAGKGFNNNLALLVREGVILRHGSGYSLNPGKVEDSALQAALNYHLRR